MAFEKLRKILEKNGFAVSVFETGQEAADYLNREIDGTTVGVGGSVTIQQIELLPRLRTHNEVYFHWGSSNPAEALQKAMTADVYLMSANAIAEEGGEILNMDGNGNRAASSLYGHRKVYLIVGKNKIAPNFPEAYARLRNVAGPKNAQRLGKCTPCAALGDQCYQCSSPERICNAMVVHYRKIGSMEMEIVLIDEELGY